METTNKTVHEILPQYRQEMQAELHSILTYWQQYSVDSENGGFFGKINNANIPDVYAPKGIVLNARILWTFAAAYTYTKNKEHLELADRAFYYLLTHFKDTEYGGVYWSVDYKGNWLEGRKQMYGHAFLLYGLSEYFFATQNKAVLNEALELYDTIEKYSFDTINNGYFEALSRFWKPAQDLRLSDKDANASKTMNTHLHIVEAYANLYKVWPDEGLQLKIENLLFLFDTYFINRQTGHLILFFDDVWKEQPDVVSFGHDIEAAWLLLRCAETIDNADWMVRYKLHALSVTKAAEEGLDGDGGLWYEFDPQHNKLVKEKHWWPQAEAMIGFMNAYEISGDERYAKQSWNAWLFTRQYILDKQKGEWFWGVDELHNVMPDEDKAGFWKCPYHNARACLELIKRTA